MEICQNFEQIRANVKKAAQASGRDEKDITIVAATKTQSVDTLLKAKDAGIEYFGENKVQELVDKYPHIENIKWHFIGKLQKNKVKYIIDKVEMIHSVDNMDLAREINKRAEKAGKRIPVLIQINIGEEDTKSGIFEQDVDDFVKAAAELPYIVVSGVMAIPPAVSNPEDARIYFRKMKNIFENLKKSNNDKLDIKYLSMGMTHDYEIAIEEGANIVRVGTGLFGARNYNKGGNENV